MSIARWGHDSDVYVFENTDRKWECCGCALDGRVEVDTPSEMTEHLEGHRAAGHLVPQYAFDALAEEAA